MLHFVQGEATAAVREHGESTITHTERYRTERTGRLSITSSREGREMGLSGVQKYQQAILHFLVGLNSVSGISYTILDLAQGKAAMR